MQIYTGKKFLKFEKSPYYHNGTNFLIKVILNLRFTKLVLRIKADGYTQEAIEKAEKCFSIISPILRSNFYIKENYEFEKHSQENTLKQGNIQYLYCYTDNGKLIGSLNNIKKYLDYDCVCDKEYNNVLFSRKFNGYIGFSHRASQVFKIGDMLFDEKWRPEIKDITYEMIDRFEKTNKGLNNKNYKLKDKAVECIPFRKRGFKKIETKEECRQAARNFALYVS